MSTPHTHSARTLVKVKQNDAFAIIVVLSLYSVCNLHTYLPAPCRAVSESQPNRMGGNKMCKEIIFNLDRDPVYGNGDDDDDAARQTLRDFANEKVCSRLYGCRARD